MRNIRKLYDLEQKTSLGANVVLLFLFLQQIKGTEKSIIISDYDLSKTLRLARKTIITAKNTLKKNGLIYFTSEKGKATEYTFPKKIQKTEYSVSEKSEIIDNLEIEDSNTIKNNYPTIDEFLEYARSLAIYDESLELKVREKYTAWLKLGWKNAHGIPISNWQLSLKSILPYMKNGNYLTEIKIPTIKRPKI